MSQNNDPVRRQEICDGFLELSNKLATLADELDVLIKAYVEFRFGEYKSPLPTNPIRQAYRGVLDLMMDARSGECRVLSRESFNRILAECPEAIGG